MWPGLRIVAAAIALMLSAIASVRAQALPPLLNTAGSTYQLPGGPGTSSISNPSNTQKIAFAAILVTPKETQPAIPADNQALGSNATRTFTITNTSDITDAYVLTNLSAGAQKILSVSYTNGTRQIPVTVGSTISPSVAPGGQIQVVVVVATTGMTVGQSQAVDITAKTTSSATVNGAQSDNGRQYIVASQTTTLSGPNGPNTTVQKTVNQTSSINTKAGQTAVFDIVAMNSGNAVATNISIVDNVPAGLTPVSGSGTIDGKSAGAQAVFNGQTVTFSIPTLAIGAKVDVAFGITVAAGTTIGNTYVNTATIGADGIPPQPTTPASILDGDANIVFDGSVGGNAPIGSAVVTLLDATGQPVKLSAARATANTRAFAAQYSNNPDVTGTNGQYGFALDPSLIGPSGSPFTLTIQASGYRDRKIGLMIVPDPVNVGLYDVTAASLDAQPLAKAGAFTLTGTAVTLSNVFGLFGNLPMFKNAGIVVTKVGDRTTVTPGDKLDFQVTYTNATLADIVPATIVDTLPPGLVYAPGTATLNGSKVEPVVSGRTLTWTIADLASGTNGTLTYSTVVFPGVSPGSYLTNGVQVSAPPGANVPPGSSTFSFYVNAGPFADRRVVAGRVFVDKAGSGHFERGDAPVPGVRIYAEDGSFAVTDANGKFSFPAMRPGMHVLRIDASSLPKTVRLFGENRMNSTRASQRLIHGILDTTTMEDIEFAVQAVTP